MLGARSNDEFFDLYPGTGVVSKAWESWKNNGSNIQLELGEKLRK